MGKSESIEMPPEEEARTVISKTDSHEEVATLAYQLGMASGNLGEGAAVALFMFPFLALVILWQLLYLRKEDSQ